MKALSIPAIPAIPAGLPHNRNIPRRSSLGEKVLLLPRTCFIGGDKARPVNAAVLTGLTGDGALLQYVAAGGLPQWVRPKGYTIPEGLLVRYDAQGRGIALFAQPVQYTEATDPRAPMLRARAVTLFPPFILRAEITEFSFSSPPPAGVRASGITALPSVRRAPPRALHGLPVETRAAVCAA